MSSSSSSAASPSGGGTNISGPIPLLYSRYPKRSATELQKLLRKSRATAAASKGLLQQAAQVAQLVKNDEPWISYYVSNASSMPSSAAAAQKKKGVPAATGAAAISSVHHGPGTDNSATTAGHCNTNHAVPWIFLKGDAKDPDVESNRVRELLQNRYNRIRAEEPESRADERWDKPRAPGERRRRIVRDKDAPTAPPEPPTSGYTLFVFLMTTKFRHDRGIEAEHSQAAAMQEISKIWKGQLQQDDQEYYNDMAVQIRKEYEQQVLEFRATNAFRPSPNFVKLGNGQGPWIHRQPTARNALEAEIASFDTVIFPPRPPSKDEEYKKKAEKSREKRKEKMRKEAKEKQARKRAIEDALLATGELKRRIVRDRTK